MSVGAGDRSAEQIQREALSWLQLLRSGEVTQADLDALDQWRAAHPDHCRALAKANLLWDVLGKAAQEVGANAGAYRSPRSVFSRSLGRRAIFAGAAAGAAYLVARPPLHLWPSSAELMASYRTTTGERRQLSIASGLTVDLDTQTSLASPVSGDETYSLELISGQLAVSTNAGRPTIVVAASGQMTADHASFNVRCNETSATVTCTEGSVQVFCRSATTVLGPGQQVSFGPDGLGAVNKADPAVVTAWQRGLLIFRDVPLAQVIAEVNRYRPGRIILANGALAERKVVAGFRLDKIDNVVGDLTRSLGISARSLPGGVVLLS